MGNKSGKKINNEIKEQTKYDSSDIINKIKNNKIKEMTKDEKLEIIAKINPKRKQELLDFLLSNVIQDPNLQKINIKKKENKTPFLPFISKFDNYNKNINYSNFILISNDIILILTKDIYKGINEKAYYLSFPNIKENISFSINNFIVENDDYKSIFSIIKVLESNFWFAKYFEIPDDSMDFESSEKYFINEKGEEESLGIIIDNNQDKNTNIQYSSFSPIYIKRENQLFIIGVIITYEGLHIFNRNEIIDIRKKLDNIKLRFKLYQIKKLDFSKEAINDEEMFFIFDYDYINLEYLNLENKNLTDKGIKALLNNSLGKLKYLNISNNSITDEGLSYLKNLYNLNELILLNMVMLSDDYFAFLQSNSFINTMQILKCDKKGLTLRYISPNYNNFSLPNLKTLKMISLRYEILKDLKELLILDKIISRIIELDLSYTYLIDNGMLRLIKNIHFFKKIEIINLENTKITTKSIKYIEQLEKQNIKIIINKNNITIRTQKKVCNVLLGGSTIAGKTNYIHAYMDKTFNPCFLSTIGCDYRIKTYENIKFRLYDMCRWNGRFDFIIKNYIMTADGVILLFDISDRNDFEDLPKCLKMITDYFELEDFPVLIIGNKIDKEKAVEEEEIKEFLKKDEFIGYYGVSSCEFTNVDESFNFMLNYISEKEKQFPVSETIIEKKNTKKKKKK